MHRFWFGSEISRLKKGLLKYLLLHHLSETPLHGYALIKKIEHDFDGLYVPSPGVIYPTLQLLEDMGWVSHRGEKGRKIYFITDKGREAVNDKREFIEETLKLKHRRGMWFRISKAVAPSLRRMFRAIFLNREKLTDEKIEEINLIISKAAEEIERIFSG